MDKAIRVVIACGLSFGLSFIWQALMPLAAAVVVTLAVGIVLGVLAVSRSAPGVPPVYRVETWFDDYELEDIPEPDSRTGHARPPRWDYPEIKHLHGVAWYDAAIPPNRHECWVQTDGWIGFNQTQRCACGAIRGSQFGGDWFKRNSRKAKVSA